MTKLKDPAVYPREILEFPTRARAERATRRRRNHTILELYGRCWSVPDEYNLHQIARKISDRVLRPPVMAEAMSDVEWASWCAARS